MWPQGVFRGGKPAVAYVYPCVQYEPTYVTRRTLLTQQTNFKVHLSSTGTSASVEGWPRQPSLYIVTAMIVENLL
jgi:hypothetical protein